MSRAYYFITATAVALLAASAAGAWDAPGEVIAIPGAEIPGWGNVAEVRGSFGRPAGAAAKVPAVLILHGSGGVDGRGAFHAKALQEAGIATLEITMFQRNARPAGGPRAVMPHAAAALTWLGAQPGINAERLGVMGFSYGGVMSVLMASELVQERLGKDVPRPVAFAPLYPVCTNIARFLKNPGHPFYDVHTRLSASPMLIHVGTNDDYEERGPRPCDPLVAMWPAAARERTTVRYLQGATHGFDGPTYLRFHDEFAHGGRGGVVVVVPSRKDAADARAAVVAFFVDHLNR